jgi:mono/diheme cytochrome c family protein
MKNAFVFPFLISINLIFCNTLTAQNQGEQLFKSVCTACHTIGKGRLVGPDLKGINEKVPQEWLIRFIKSSQTMVKSGDKDAVAIFNEFAKVPMPDNQFSDDQIISILDYIKSADQGAPAAQAADTTAAVAADTTRAADTTAVTFTYQMVQQGRSLFEGYTPFSSGAAPCISCHNIQGLTFLGGGKLALDLTKAFTKLGASGIQAIITNPPFPAMKAAIPAPPSPDEINALMALLKSSDQRFATYTGRAMTGLAFFVISFVIGLLLLIHILLFYDNRKIPDTAPGIDNNKNPYKAF